jgi:hypothetical protein
MYTYVYIHAYVTVPMFIKTNNLFAVLVEVMNTYFELIFIYLEQRLRLFKHIVS